jgi:hypothetical protein
MYNSWLGEKGKKLVSNLTKGKMHLNLQPNEVVIKAGDSSHMNGQKLVEGKLVLTNQRICFVIKNGNGLSHEREIPFNNIKEVLFFNNRKIFPKGLNIITTEGDEYKFLVKKRIAWCEIINKMY